MRMLSLFSGIGAFEKALKNIGVEFELVNFCEFDKFAIKSYCAIHGEEESKNLGDITKIDLEALPSNIDLLTHGSPCQDFSVAGKGAGAEVGSETRSSLMWNSVQIISRVRPKVVIWENVKNVLSAKHRHNFDKYLETLEVLGYKNYYQVLNAKDYGVPQNRERIFVVSILGEHKPFEFPQKQELKLRLKDILEDTVDEKYYIAQDKVDKLISRLVDNKVVNECKLDCIGMLEIKGHDFSRRVYNSEGIARTLMGCGGNNNDKTGNYLVQPKRIGNIHGEDKGTGFAGNVWDKNSICPTLTTMQGGDRQPMITVKEATKKGCAVATVGDSINLEQPNSKTRRGRVGVGVAQTLTCSCNQATLEHNYRIRKLTPLECYRLMAFSDTDFEKASKVNSNSQLYKQAGNSIVVKVLEEIFKELYK